MTDEEALAIVEKALESGSLKQRNAVTVVTGIIGSGKIWLLSRLFRIKPPEHYTSTGVAEKSFRGLMRRIAHISSFDLLTVHQIFEFLAPLFLARIPAGDIVSLAQSFTAMQASSELIQPPSDTFSSVSSPTTSLLDVSSVEGCPPEETPSSKAMMCLVQKAKTSKEALVLELLHMIDTGGQPEFMEVMPCLIDNSDLTILVLDVTHPLDYYPTLSFHDDGTAYKKPIVSSRTNRQIIQQLVCTMQAKRGKKKGIKSSKFLVSGTHIDCVDKAKLSEVLSALNNELATMFLPMMEKELIVCKEGEIIYAVNLLNPDSDDEKLLDSVRSSIVSAGIGRKMDTPLCLFMFEQDAIKYAEEQKGKGRHVMVLSLEECLQVGARLKMSREVVQAALIYFHRHNVFLYFRHILPNLVFLDPQVPLDFVNAIVRFSYMAKSGAIQPLTAQQIRFCKEGILTEELLQHECLSTSFLPNLYEPRHALNLFQHVFTIAPLSEDSPVAESSELFASPSTTPAQKPCSKPGQESLAQISLSAPIAHKLLRIPAQNSPNIIVPLSKSSKIPEVWCKCCTVANLSPPPAKRPCTKPCYKSLAPKPNSESQLIPPAQKSRPVGKTEFLMMCLLPPKSQSEIHHCLPSTSRVSPLLVSFSNGCAPNGSFGNTVCCLISSFKWKISHIHQGKTECLAHNIVTLRPHNALVKVTLINSTYYFEIHVNAGKLKDSLLEKYCPEIHSTIFAALRKVFQTMQFDEIEIEPAFLCPCDLTSAHAAPIFPTSNVTSESLLECSETEEAVGEMEWSQGVWFQDWYREKELSPLPTTTTVSPQCMQYTQIPAVSIQSQVQPKPEIKQVPSSGTSPNMQSTQPLPTFKVTDQPTLSQFTYFETQSGSINITEQIGTSYRTLGLHLLEDANGVVTKAIRDQYQHDAAKINYEILQQWIQGKGRQPVQWSTLIDVLKKIQLSVLAKKIGDAI